MDRDNETKIVTTSNGTDIPVLMVPTRYGAGVAVIIPNFISNHLPKGSVSLSRKQGYTKPTPWPSK